MRKGQELDPDFNVTDFEFNSKTVIACNANDSSEVDEVCGHNENIMQEMKHCTSTASEDSWSPAECNPIRPSPSNPMSTLQSVIPL